MSEIKLYGYTLLNHSGGQFIQSNMLLAKGTKFIYNLDEYIVIDNHLNCGNTNDDRTYKPCPICNSVLLDNLNNTNTCSECKVMFVYP
jgi:hypothetical protein